MQTKDYDRVILGIDPGTNVTGYGVLGVRGKKPELIVMGVIKLSGYGDHYLKLGRVHERVTALISQYLPDELAIEAPFFGKNVQSMLKLGRVQGVAIAAAIARQVPIAEYAPRSIKMAITGTGTATKERVALMLRNILSIPADEMPSLLDATDALGVALTHFYESGKPVADPSMVGRSGNARRRSGVSWADFVRQHPDRLAGR